MKTSDLFDLLLLAAIWGASFLFLRVSAGEFGPAALAFVRVIGGALFLLPIVAMKGHAGALRRKAGHLMVAGVLTSGIPFLCYSFAALSITAGLSSIFNATTPLFGAVVAWWWLKDKPTRWRAAGLAIGFLGVLWLAWDKASFKPGADATGWAVVACLVATFCYGLSASYTRRYLQGVPPLAVAAGTQLGASAFLALPALLTWPDTLPSARSWGAAVALALLCTGIAYILYFRLLARVGPANTIAVTFLIPAFAVAWGWLFLGEGVTLAMLIGSAVILLGTALATGLLPRKSA
ncbi:DMT family transporter [Eleftheria terrae]|uniref:DMT family transporter n=1 Tax=Eleftheria terrae TaxID=1597781 RepID=UPI00263BB6A9|nr:DMT family transporter [Eleftheria terrae]WKB52572.1 DMT family transporter [Eleftheria terrae]